MKKYSLINIGFEFQEGDVIVFEMPGFCSGDYEAVVMKDPIYGFYIDKKDAFFKGCRDFSVKRNDLYIKL